MSTWIALAQARLAQMEDDVTEPKDDTPRGRSKVWSQLRDHVPSHFLAGLAVVGVVGCVTFAASQLEAAAACGPEAREMVRKGEERFSRDDLVQAGAYANASLVVSRNCSDAHWLAARIAHKRMRVAQTAGAQDAALAEKLTCWREIVAVHNLWGRRPDELAVRKDCGD